VRIGGQSERELERLCRFRMHAVCGGLVKCGSRHCCGGVSGLCLRNVDWSYGLDMNVSNVVDRGVRSWSCKLELATLQQPTLGHAGLALGGKGDSRPAFSVLVCKHHIET
jgi:hypothetical protein